MRRRLLIPTAVSLAAGFVIGTIATANDWSYDLTLAVAAVAIGTILAVTLRREERHRSLT